eukprot:6202323-Pleurochrysis_carterae.AAC.3
MRLPQPEQRQVRAKRAPSPHYLASRAKRGRLACRPRLCLSHHLLWRWETLPMSLNEKASNC